MSPLESPSGEPSPPANDFPYYNDRPVGLSPTQWWLLMLATAAGFAMLFVPLPVFATKVGRFVPPILFFAIPLLTLRAFAGTHWTAIFRKLRGRDILLMIGFALLNLVVTMSVGLLTKGLFETTANPIGDHLRALGPLDQGLMFAQTGFQLFGEEVVTILPFLAIMHLCHQRFGCSRRSAMITAWVLSAVIFGLLHLSSYNWNILQCVVLIGTARLVLSLAYILTKNIWVSAGAHILNDWSMFAFGILASASA